MHASRSILSATFAAALLLCAPQWAAAQAAGAGGPAPAESASKKAEAPVVSVSVRDADVRRVLEDLFRQARISNFAISNDVTGTVTLTVKDKPFEEVLTLITRVASAPLSWSKTDDVYFVRLRSARRATDADAPAPPAPDVAVLSSGGTRYEIIKLMYTDPRAIVELLDRLRPENMTAAVAIEASNDVLTRWGPEGSADFVAATMPVEWNRLGQSATGGFSGGGSAGVMNAPGNSRGTGLPPAAGTMEAPVR